MAAQSPDSLAKIARDLGMSGGTLREWVLNAEHPATADTLSESERTELLRLRRENRQLQIERDILKKATAFFARQSE